MKSKASFPTRSRDELCIDTIRMLAIDAVQKANSGHPGTPMALAPVAYTLWQEFLRYDPLDPLWPDRDRFVLSAGHASMLLYALLHLAGVRRVEGGRVGDKLAVALEDIERFRQLDSVTPGHPEYGHTTGVETTTGPLGQGCGNSVGMAIASRWHAKRYNRPRAKIFDYDVYAICSDGDLMEGVASEAASLAGHLQAREPVLDLRRQPHHDRRPHRSRVHRGRRGALPGLRLERAAGRGRQRLRARRRGASATFRRTRDRPTLIRVRSVIGYGAPHKQGTAEDALRAAGRGRGARCQARLRLARGCAVPGARRRARALRRRIGGRGRQLREAWQRSFAAWQRDHREAARELRASRRASCRRAGTRSFPILPPTARTSPRGRPRPRC